MGKLGFSIVLVGAAACGNNNAVPDAHLVIADAAPDSKVFMDAPAPVYDFSCIGNAAPTTASATITINGTVFSAQSAQSAGPEAGVTVDTCINDCTSTDKLDTQVSAATTGAFTTAAIATPGNGTHAPLNAYFHAVNPTAGVDRPTRFYPASPLTADVPLVPIIMLGANLIPSIVQQSSKGVLGLAITDCGLQPIADSSNITLSIKQNNVPISGDLVVDASTYSSMAAGAFIVINAPPGDTEVNAMYMGMTFRAHTVKVEAGGTTDTIIRPGY